VLTNDLVTVLYSVLSSVWPSISYTLYAIHADINATAVFMLDGKRRTIYNNNQLGNYWI
jgi:hypothetical protein